MGNIIDNSNLILANFVKKVKVEKDQEYFSSEKTVSLFSLQKIEGFNE